MLSTLLAAASWFVSRRRSERDDLIQDLQIRDALEIGSVRDRLEDSIDERAARLSRRAERRRNDTLLDIARPLAWMGVLSFLAGATGHASWAATAGLVLVGLSGVLFGIGFPKDGPTDRSRLTKRRPPRAAPATASTPAPGAVSTPLANAEPLAATDAG
jgi:hypothetical protein